MRLEPCVGSAHGLHELHAAACLSLPPGSLRLRGAGTAQKATCLRWVVLARQLSEQHKSLKRQGRLASATARVARVALLGRHWVVCVYNMLATCKGLGVAAQAEALWVQVR